MAWLGSAASIANSMVLSSALYKDERKLKFWLTLSFVSERTNARSWVIAWEFGRSSRCGDLTGDLWKESSMQSDESKDSMD
jgi:hypothetical protein